MSGIVGIVTPETEPVDRDLLQAMTRHMAFRGPDAQNSFQYGNVGLGHAMLRTTTGSIDEIQPVSLNGYTWITADARIDGRESLHRKLAIDSAEIKDSHLILLAYEKWGICCVEHLLGDFAFAIWDSRDQSLFCARDHLGIKPFYYSIVESGTTFLFSNNLDTLRLHPQVSNNLNDLAIVNYILFSYQPKIDITSFEDIQSLLPAHTLIWKDGRIRIDRYWELPVEDPIRYRRSDEYVEHFLSLFDTAVGDRMRTDKLAILLSGGMDSTSIAATVGVLGELPSGPVALHGYTFGHLRQPQDKEHSYAQMVADKWGFPIDVMPLDDIEYFTGWDRPDFYTSEPLNQPLWSSQIETVELMIDHGNRVALSGWGGDPLLIPEPTYAATMLRHGQFSGFASDCYAYMRDQRGPPPLGIRTWFRDRKRDPSEVDPDMIRLLHPNLNDRMQLPPRWWQLNYEPPQHPWRPNAYSEVINPYWTESFRLYDAANVESTNRVSLPVF